MHQWINALADLQNQGERAMDKVLTAFRPHLGAPPVR